MNDDTWRNDVTMLDTARTEAPTPTDRPADDRVGIWLVGARGSIGTTVAVGLHVIANELAAPTGCTTAGDEFVGVPLPRFADLVLGGHDISTTSADPARAAARRLGHDPAPPRRRGAGRTRAGRRRDPARLRPRRAPTAARPRSCAGSRPTSPTSARATPFARVVVVDISSTEPIPEDRPEFHDTALLAEVLADPDAALLPASAITALAAIESGSAYACFTPSVALTLPGHPGTRR